MIRYPALDLIEACSAVLAFIPKADQRQSVVGAQIRGGCMFVTDRNVAARCVLPGGRLIIDVDTGQTGDPDPFWLPRDAVAWVAALRIDARPKRSAGREWISAHTLDVQSLDWSPYWSIVLRDPNGVVKASSTFGPVDPVGELYPIAEVFEASALPVTPLVGVDVDPYVLAALVGVDVDPYVLAALAGYAKRWRKLVGGRADEYERIRFRFGSSTLLSVGRVMVAL